VNRRAALFLLLYLAAILYLSLYPWTFVPSPVPRTLDWVPLNSRRAILDAFLNVVFYLPLGAAAFASIRRGAAVALVASVFFGTFVSFTVEWTQLSIPTRVGNLTDLLCNSAGIVLGAAVACALTSRRVRSRLRPLSSPSAVLIGLWAVWQSFLFLPRYGPMIDVSHVMIGVVVLTLGVLPRKIPFAAPLLLLWLAYEELRPFHFQTPPQPFLWLPFESWFVGAPETYYGIFWGKLFLYTSILRIERKSGMAWIRALAAPGAILFAGELAQRYLPGRTPESTDLFLLAAGAVLLNLTEPSGWDNKGRA
jgi:VanZ family protein